MMRTDHHQRGYTIIELLIAMLIGAFLLGGLLTVVQDNGRVFREQNTLAQLQDNERLALTMITDVVQAAGYFTDPTTNTLTSALPVVAPFATAGQSVFGAHNAAAPGDTLTVRYMTASGDGILNCAGTSNATGANQVYVNSFTSSGPARLQHERRQLHAGVRRHEPAGALRASRPTWP